MENLNKISVERCCTIYSIETTFIHQLHEHGLIELSHSNEDSFIDFDHLADLEKYMHLHYDLEINFAGLEAIKHLLERVESLQNQIKRLENNVLIV